MKIDRFFLNFKRGRTLVIMRLFSLKKKSHWNSKMHGSSNKFNIYFFFTSSLCKIMRRFCFVSIVKRWYMLLLTFDPIKNQEKNRKKNPNYKRIYMKKA
jgi:hypothetical protein